MKKIYLILFFLLFAIGIQAQTGTYTANGLTWRYWLKGSEASITGLDGSSPISTNALNIPATITIGSTTYPVTEITNQAFNYWGHHFTSLNLPNGLKRIGAEAFFQCTGLTGTLVIPNSVTEIGAAAFEGCRFTGHLVIPDGITKIEGEVFGSNEFTSVTFPSNVTEIGRFAFSYTKLQSITIPNTVTTIRDGAFLSCREAKGSLIIPSSVTTIEKEAFENCQNLTGDLIIPKTVTTLEGGAFQQCERLGSITFESGSSINLNSTNYFFACNSLKYIDATTLPSITKTIDRSDYNSPFYGTQSHTMVYLPTGSSTPVAGQENFVLNGMCEKFMVYENPNGYGWYLGYNAGGDYPIKHPFTAVKASYDRSFSGSSGADCKTLYLPYPAKLPEGMRAYILLKRSHHGGNSYYFSFGSIGDGGTQLQANTPYLVRILDGGTHTFDDVDNVVVPVSPDIETNPNAVSISGGDYVFLGTTENIKNDVAAAKNLYNLDWYNIWLPIRTDNTNGFVHSMRAVIKNNTSSTPAHGFFLVFDDEEETNGIEGTEQEIEKVPGKIYTIEGKFVGTDITKLESGHIYIKNGHKFYKY